MAKQTCAERFEAFRLRRQQEIMQEVERRSQVVAQRNAALQACRVKTPCSCHKEKEARDEAEAALEREMKRHQNLRADTPKARAIYQRDCVSGGLQPAQKTVQIAGYGTDYVSPPKPRIQNLSVVKQRGKG